MIGRFDNLPSCFLCFFSEISTCFIHFISSMIPSSVPELFRISVVRFVLSFGESMVILFNRSSSLSSKFLLNSL